MAWGTIQIGQLALKETDILEDVTNANTGVRTVRFEGAETNPGATQETIEARQQDVMSMMGKVYPVTFQRKSSYDGFYRIDDINTVLEKWAEGPGQVRWSLSLSRIGPENSVDIESRIVNPARANDFTLTGTRWHSPAIGAKGYFTGATVPSAVDRIGTDGTQKVYLGIPANTNPRWAIAPSAYGTGRVRFIRNGIERMGERVTIIGSLSANWEMNNGLIKVTFGGQGLDVSAWAEGAWRVRSWGIFHTSGDLIAPYDAMTVIRNDPEQVTIRIFKDAWPSATNPGGRVLLDVTLRRGAYFAECLLQRSTASNELKVRLNTSVPWSTGNGYVVEEGVGSDGTSAFIATPRTFVTHANGGIIKSAVTELAFALGAIVPGAESAPAIANDSFEQGSLNGWELAGAPDGYGRVSETVSLTDTFTRTLPSTWGGTGVGAWTQNAGANVTHSVDGTRGVITHATAGSSREILLNALGRDDVDITITDLQFNRTAAGDNPEFTLACKISGSGADRIQARIFWTTANAITCNITERIANVSTATTAFPGVPSATNSTPVNVRFRVDGKYYKLKVWRTVDPEPSAWTVTLTGTTALAAGAVSAATSVPGSYTGTLSAAFSLADFTVSPDPVKYGSFSGKLVSHGVGIPRMDSSFHPATAGKSYTAYGWLWPVLVTGQVRLSIHWFNGSTFLSSSHTNSAAVPGIWTPYQVPNVVAPANTTQAKISFALPGPAPAGEILLGDGFRLHEAMSTGNSATELRDQYIAAPNERAVVIPR